MNLYREPGSVRPQVNTEVVNLTTDGICAACRGLIRDLASAASSPGLQHHKGTEDFITCYHLAWDINKIVIFLESIGASFVGTQKEPAKVRTSCKSELLPFIKSTITVVILMLMHRVRH